MNTFFEDYAVGGAMEQSKSKSWLSGGGVIGKIIANHDWTKSHLGPIATWPQSLKTALSICLCSKFPMGIWWGPEFVVFYNDAYIPIAGKLKHPMHLGRPAIEMWPEIWDVVGKLAANVFEDGTATWQEDLPLFMMRENGLPEERYFTFSFSPARDEIGAVGGMFYAVQEMTSRVISERRLSLLRRLGAEEVKSMDDVVSSAMRSLSKSPNEAPFGIIYLTDENSLSASLAGSFGIPTDSKLTPNSIDLNDFKEAPWPFAQVIQDKKALCVDGLLTHYKDFLPSIPYEEKPGSAYVMPIVFAGQSTPGGFLILGINPRLTFNESYVDFFSLVVSRITNHFLNIRSLEQEKKRSEAFAEIDRAKTAFFSNVSHEFRTPLTLILGPIEDILSGEKGELPPRLRAETEAVHRNALRLLNLVNTLLDFSRIEAGRARAIYVSTDIAQLTKNIAASFRSAIEKAGLKFNVKTEFFPEAVYVDRDMWEKIVSNLLSNAFKYTFEGEIEVKLEKSGNFAKLTVRDTGVGIPESEISKVFKRFHRIEGARGRTYEGTGIGLSLVEELIKLHSGTSGLVSQVGKGSTFTVSIPLGTAHIPKDRIPESTLQETLPASTAQLYTAHALRWLPDYGIVDSAKEAGSELNQTQNEIQKKHLLIADDNADMRDYVKGLLTKDYHVTAVEDGEKALASIFQTRPDLIISDIMMPGMGGIELLQELRAHEELLTIPIILLSARAGDEAKSSGIEMGADDYLTKPFSAKELLARVRTQLYMAEVRKSVVEKNAAVIHLSQQQQWLQKILDLVPTPLILMEPETGRMKFANQAAHQMAGGKFPLNIPAGKFDQFFQLTDFDGNSLLPEEFPASRALKGEKVRNAQVVWHSPAGKFSLLVNSELVSDGEGHSPMIILCLNNVTPLKEIEVELRRSIESRDEFLSVASHELKTPLTSLKLQVQLIQRRMLKGDPDALAPSVMAAMVDLTDRQVVRLSQLVDDMLDVSRIESGNLSLNRERFELSELISDIVGRLSRQAKFAGTEIRIKNAEKVSGNWDRIRLEQVLNNLLTNCFRYGHGNGIDIHLHSTQHSAKIVVQDYGQGIAERDLARIFERFERANTQNEVSGLGLGLYISKKIVEAHGGHLHAESELGKGTSFTVDLPLH